jgi:hypothetical protein
MLSDSLRIVKPAGKRSPALTLLSIVIMGKDQDSRLQAFLLLHAFGHSISLAWNSLIDSIEQDLCFARI